MMEYIGKCLFIEDKEANERILVVGDIHIGQSFNKSPVDAIVNQSIFQDMMNDFEKLFSKLKRVDEIVLLGDIKHGFSSLEQEERNDIVNLFEYLEKKASKVSVIKGNHDNFLLNVLSGRKIAVVNYYIKGKYCFLHGDNDFEEIYDSNIKYWIMGHMHPAIKLSDGKKIEKYKCFLSGKFKDKEIIILPSFAETNEGIDVRELDRELPWKFNLGEFDVHIVSDDLKALEFGKLKKI